MEDTASTPEDMSCHYMESFYSESTLQHKTLTTKNKDDSFVVPPPQPILPHTYSTSSDSYNTGLNIYFKKVEPFSQDEA